jgi:hypothetical protein
MILPTETSLIGRWILRDGTTTADDACRRIDELVSQHLVQLARAADGWSTLYRDPADGRLWEHFFPNGDMHGGGPPALRHLSLDEARHAYGYES